MKTITLNNGIQMPMVGYGVFQVDPKECERCVTDAISAGYRMIDTAQFYRNEEGVGAAVAKSGFERKEFFLVTKIWYSDYGYGKAKEAIEKSLERLQTGYIDLMLLHQPYGDYYGAYRALEEAYEQGYLRAIGVSNFYPDHLIDLANHVAIKPAINQIEMHVFYQQQLAQKYASEFGTELMAWAPLAQGHKDFFTNPVLTAIAAKYGKTVGQVALRWLLQRNVIVIPKTVNPERMKENFDLFDFTLSDEDMQAIAQLETGKSLFFDHHDPEVVKQFMGWKL